MSNTRFSHLHFVQSIEPLEGGGLGRAALELNDAFAAAGMPSRLVATHGGRPQTTGKSGVEEFARSGPAKFYYSSALRRAAPRLVADAQVVHAHGFYVGTNMILGGEARRQGRSLVCHAHGFFEPWILSRSRARKQLVHLVFENANFDAAKLWRALTEKEADQIRAHGITAPIVVAANGIQLSVFDSIDPAIAASKWSTKSRRRLVFLARLHPKKGLDLLVPAWAKSGAASRGWELVLAGPDELGHRAEIEKLIRELDVGDSISLPGTMSGADKVALLRSADAFALSSYSEGFSVAILEAMACRLPVIATHACNFPEIESDGGGWLCDATLDSVTDAVRRLVETPDEELRQRGLAARSLVERRFTWPSIAKTILDACSQHC